MLLNENILEYIENHREEALSLLIELAQIPAPSNHEEKRAEFCKSWLEKQGAQGVYIDEALNVIYPVGVTQDNPLMLFCAHTDVVFPDTEALPLTVADGRIFCPGAGDDTASVAALLTAAKYIAENKLAPKDCGLLIVLNAGEEGLGDLKGCRRLMQDFGGRIAEFVSFDSHLGSAVSGAVGSKRYRIEFDTEGGHSLGNFGNRNAIAYLASLINTLYTMKVPEEGVCSYNVGTISGGTSVNTIAQHAEMLYEFRSDNRRSMEIMERHLNAALELYRAKGVTVTVTQVGDRPCGGDVDPEKQSALMKRASASVARNCGLALHFGSGSTDCNIPLSMGIPSLCVGCYTGSGAHTREEYVDIDSLLPGLCVAFDMVLHHF